MTYGIITHYDVHNHGALLQLNALTKVLRRDFGIEARALRFDKNYDFMGRNMKAKYDLSAKSVGIYLRYLLDRGISDVLFNIKKKRTLETFKKSNDLIGPYYSECGELDGVIIGSDEVFALHTGPTPVFFGHACPSQKVFAYGGCFGPTTIEDIDRLHCRAFVSSGLSTMCGLGMRDRNSREIATALTGRKAEAVCDPVILYGYKDEIERLTRPKLPPYLVVYAYNDRMNSSDEVARIKAYAKSRGLKIVSPGFYHKWVDHNVNADPVELLAYFKGATVVITDTFHGAVMSLITGREFTVKLRDNANKLLNLLEEYKLTARVLSDEWNLEKVFSEKIDYAAVNAEIARRRAASMDYLRQPKCASKDFYIQPRKFYIRHKKTYIRRRPPCLYPL